MVPIRALEGEIVLSQLRQGGPRSGGLIQSADCASLPAGISSYGYDHLPQGAPYRFPGSNRRPAAALLQYTLSGSGEVQHNDALYPVPPGNLMLLHWPHNHCYRLPSAERWEFVYAIIRGGEALRLLRAVEQELGPSIPLGDDHPAMTTFLPLVADCLEGGAEALTASERIYAVIIRLLAHARARRGDLPQAQAIQAAMAYASERLHLAIGVGDLARAAGLSRYHFSRLFRRVTGDSPAAWLQSARLQQAAGLLRDTRLSLSEIAQRSGFANAHYFAKVFRRTFAVSPGRFRSGGG